MGGNYRYFQNRACEYFPCHAGEAEHFNCLFCFCPLYVLGDGCGGDFAYTDGGIKDCSGCTFPHQRENYDAVMEKLRAVTEMAKR